MLPRPKHANHPLRALYYSSPISPATGAKHAAILSYIEEPMPKTHTKFVCQQCGFETTKFLGRCPDCNEWNSLVETLASPTSAKSSGGNGRVATLARGGHAEAIPLPQVEILNSHRLVTGSPELDRVLGGGIVPGSLILLAGEPGIGKSSLLLQVAGDVALQSGGEVLYVSAEESAQQVKLRAERLGISTERLLLLPETELEAIIEIAERVKPALIVVDSIQT